MSDQDRFDVSTFEERFAGEGRKITVKHSNVNGFPIRQGTIETADGWWFSAVWGYCTYCQNHGDRSAPLWSPDAEVMPSAPGRVSLEVDGDSVVGWVSPAQLGRAVIAAERGDVNGVVLALSGKESNRG